MALISRSLRGTASQVSASLVALLLLLIPLASCGGPSQTVVPTPTPASLQFTPFDLRLPAAALTAPVVGTLPAETVMQVTISLKLHQAVLDQLKHQKVKVGQQRDLRFLANQLGISDATYHQIQQTLGISGVSMRLSSLHTSLNVEAKAALVAAAFQTQFVLHTLDGRTFYAPATTPKVPTFLAPLILAITGLDNFSPPVTPRHSSLGQHLNTLPARLSPGGSCPPLPAPYVNPGDVAHAYGYDQLWNQGWHGESMTVNLVEIDGFNQSDVQHYFQCVNSPGKLKVVDVGTRPSTHGDESTLDIEMLAGLAPAVNIVDYETNVTGTTVSISFLQAVETELQRIIDDNAEDSTHGSIVSVSLGSAESRAGQLLFPNDISAIDQEFQILTQVEHMTVFVASGDCGAFDNGTNGDLSVDAFAASPDVIAVGGTELTVDGSHQRSGEVAWFLGPSVGHCASTGTAPLGSGGGISLTMPQPAWQTGAGVRNQYSNGHRQLPDVSAVALYLPEYFQGTWQIGVGTSAAAPIWAAGFSLVEQGLIQRTGNYLYGPDTFYAVAHQSNGATPYYDVTQDAAGTTPHFPATPGWDYATGLGTPNLADFYATTVALVGAEGEGEGEGEGNS